MANKADTPAARRQQCVDLIDRFFRAYEFAKSANNHAGEPYKGDVFKIFVEAYRNNFCGCKLVAKNQRAIQKPRWSGGPRIDGDQLWQAALDRKLVTPKTRASTAAYAIIRVRCQWWDAWTYAWDHNPPTRRYRRNRT